MEMADYRVNIGDMITKWATIEPEKIALFSEDVPYTYRELANRIDRLCRLLLDGGIEKGDRVAVLLYNSKQYIETFFALSRLGGLLVPLNWRLALPELQFIIEDSGSRFIIFEKEFTATVELIRKKTPMDAYVACGVGEGVPVGKTPGWAMDYEASLAQYTGDKPSVPWAAGDEDPHILMYTSGTTGVPKGALLSHKKTFFNVLNADVYFDLRRSDIAVIGRPMFHSGGLIVEMAPLLYKGATVIVKKRFTPDDILQTVQKHKVTILELPATVYNFMLSEGTMGACDLSSLRCCFTGGERVPIPLLRAFAAKGLPISQIYGLTEASTLFWLPIGKAGEKIGSVGKPVLHGDVRIIKENGGDVGVGEVGEIVVKGPIVMSGYWKRPDLTGEVIRDGWLHTGDLARIDDEGFVYIMDRKKDMFISGGENVYPAEVEKALFNHPAVADAAVAGVDDQKWGEVGKAFIVVKAGFTLTKEEILGFLNEKLARYKIPKYVVFISELPKTASGKIKKHLLRKL
jgi:fatty-acyl-CoA synthase